MSSRFPEWLRRPWPSGDSFGFTKDVMADLRLNTVCQSARCPNIGECWGKGTATIMVLGNTCSRNCVFCSVPSGKPESLDAEEPANVAEAVARMGLRHAVVTTVVRDDLPDGGAAHIAQTIRFIHETNPGTTVEILVSDFNGDLQALSTVLDARPEIFSHNIETVRRLYDRIRDRRFGYTATLHTLRAARAHSSQAIIKSALMVGHGETPDDVRETLCDLLDVGCEAVCIGQYLQPSRMQTEVKEFVTPGQFETYEKLALGLGFKHAVCGPFVRSSYRSEEVLQAPFARRRLATA